MMLSRYLVCIRSARLLTPRICCNFSKTMPFQLITGLGRRDLFSTETPYNSNKNISFDGIIPLNELQISYSSASGPGGQHVNKAQSKVQIRFHVSSATWIPEDLKPYLLEKESHRITKDGFFVIQSDKTRYQLLNQADCLERIRRMIRERLREMHKPPVDAETLEKHRAIQVRENEKRLAVKRSQSMTKAYRHRPSLWDL